VIELTNDKEVLYNAEVTQLKSADKGRRILRTVLIFIFELGFLFFISYFLGFVFAIIFFIISVVIFIPSPMLITPSNYRVMKNGVQIESGKLIPFKKGYKASMNEDRSYVSILHPRRGELIRLYTNEPSKLLGTLRRDANLI
jgi:uncharacterized membrane protein